MLEIIISQSSFFILIALFALGAIGSLFLRKNDKLANIWSSFFAVTGSALGLVFSIATIVSGRSLDFARESAVFPLLKFSFHIDLLSAFFIFTISLVAFFCSIYGAGYIKHYYKKYSLGSLGFFYNLLLMGLMLVVTASNGLFFIVAWEMMSIAAYFLVVYDRHDSNSIRAGWVYLVMTFMGTIFIMLAFLLLYKYVGSFDFAVIKSSISLVPDYILNAVFVFALIGFGTKAGIIPFHIWLPAAHSAAPSHVSALMSGIMIKTGIYMMIRLFLDILQPIPVWWGLTILVIGAVSALLGVLYAITEHDIKRLLAYHSIENIGIILLGLGSALTFYSLGMNSLALLGIMAALFHVLNHAIFKSLLFLSAGSIINQVHTRNMEEYGGLIRYMPQTAMFFLIGSMAISALPPFNGFFSEWLTFQALFQGIAESSASVQWVFILAAGSLAFTGGLALACFVKVFGMIFLARPRSKEVLHAKESEFSMRVGMGALAFLSILFGLFSGYAAVVLEKISKGFTIFTNTPSFVSTSAHQSLQVGDGFASASAPTVFILFVIVMFVVFMVTHFVINRKQKVTIGDTWDCGTNLAPRMEITTTGFARSIVLIFKNVLKPSIQHDVEYEDAQSRYLPKLQSVTLDIGDLYKTYIYHPIYAALNKVSVWIKSIQSGNVNLYISYIFITLVIILFSIL